MGIRERRLQVREFTVLCGGNESFAVHRGNLLNSRSRPHCGHSVQATLPGIRWPVSAMRLSYRQKMASALVSPVRSDRPPGGPSEPVAPDRQARNWYPGKGTCRIATARDCRSPRF